MRQLQFYFGSNTSPPDVWLWGSELNKFPCEPVDWWNSIILDACQWPIIWIKTEEDVPHVLFYSSLIISVWVRRIKKLIILFIKVAPNCHGKRNSRGAKERDSRREKWREVMISRWPLYCIFLSHSAPRQLVPNPTPSFMPWGHCYFFCRDSCGPSYFTNCLHAFLVRPHLSVK